MVALVEQHDFVAGLELGQQQPGDGRHARGVEHRRLAAFQRGQLALGHVLAGIAVAAIFLAGLLLGDEVDRRLRVGERVGGRAEDRVGHRVARLLAVFAGVNRLGRKSSDGESGSSANRRLESSEVSRSLSNPRRLGNKKTATGAPEGGRGWLRSSWITPAAWAGIG